MKDCLVYAIHPGIDRFKAPKFSKRCRVQMYSKRVDKGFLGILCKSNRKKILAISALKYPMSLFKKPPRFRRGSETGQTK